MFEISALVSAAFSCNARSDSYHPCAYSFAPGAFPRNCPFVPGMIDPDTPYGTVELLVSFETRNEEHGQQLLDLILQAPGTDLVESE